MSSTLLASNFTSSPVTKDSITSLQHGEYTFDQLVQDLKMYLGSSRGIGTEQVDHRVLMAFMSKYASNRADWSRFARNDPSKNYTRNLVANINGRANLVSCFRSREGLKVFWLTMVAAGSRLEPRERISDP